VIYKKAYLLNFFPKRLDHGRTELNQMCVLLV
jgi:hypothetical protein